ncbi:MAG: hypothetical protein AAF483_30115, partial [Planctomycetota bacterium]
LATTYGLMYRSMFDLIYQDAEQLLAHASASGEEFIFPLLTKHQDLIHQYLRGCATRSSLLNVVVGACARAAFMHALEWGRVRKKENRTAGDLVPFFVRQLSQIVAGELDPGSIKLSKPANGLAVNARGLLEHMAVLETLNRSSFLGLDHSFVAQRMMNTSTVDEYTSVGIFWNVNHRERFTGPKRIRDSDWISSIYASYPVEHYAAVDLALMPPFLPEGFSEHRVWNWADIEPGNRFDLASRWISDNVKNFTSLCSDDRESVFVETQNALCEAFDWPQTDFLTNAWAHHLGSEAWRRRNTFVTFKKDITIEFSELLLRQRSVSPLDFVINNFEPGFRKQVDFVGWITRETEGYQFTGTADDASSDALKCFFLQRAANAVVLGDPQFCQQTASQLKTSYNVLAYQLFGADWDQSFLETEFNATFRFRG